MNPINPYNGLLTGIASKETRSNPEQSVSNAGSEKNAVQPAGGNSVAQDHLTLSPKARQLMAAQKESSASTEQLAAIRSSIVNGSYQIAPQQIGLGLTQDNQQFMPNKPGTPA
ncbi:hypothetical protein B1757_05425 [Acidithiobacillus marinus]|uniref:Anti-sigma-28 factor FlgM C-terminal domain-containing protein n=1 Tax=Acidithiobacillus marinus TaxID=187490 RepID=A0A2I1DMY0_9PROT|nr:flagellar biosynthesis anti-sigma factor FlgM [Acidithiobacillus marinus]PKY11230.1 hypothetical protein B1757_05425 [Acidithiobacillus marinus]